MEIEDLKLLLDKYLERAWCLYLYKSSKKNYSVYQIKVDEQTMMQITSRIVGCYKSELSNLNEICEYDRGFEEKVNIIKLSCDDLRIKDYVQALVTAIYSSNEDYKLSNDGYILVGEKENDSPIVFITKSNPIVSLKKLNIFSLSNDARIENDKYIKLNVRTDCLIYNNFLYASTLKFEKIFYLDDAYKKQIENNKNEFLQSGLIDDSCHKYFTKLRYFLDYNDEKVRNVISGECNNELEVLKKYINFNYENEKITLDEKRSANILVKYFCGKIRIEGEKAFYDNSVELPKIKVKKDEVVA